MYFCVNMTDGNIYLFLNSIGTGEIVAIMVIVLILFGADSIPKIARTLGRGVRQMKDATQEIQRDINRSANQSAEDFDIKRQIEDSITGKDRSKDKDEDQNKA